MIGRAQSAAQSNDELTGKLALHFVQHNELPSVEVLERQLQEISRDDVLALVPAFGDGLTIAVMP